MTEVRRVISMLLLAVFGLPFALPMLALGEDAEARLPACCRRNGKHHCMMSLDDRGRLVSDETRVQAPAERCPFRSGSVAPVQGDLLAGPGAGGVVRDALVSDPTGVVRTESKRRNARDRSRQKRGPPAMIALRG